MRVMVVGGGGREHAIAWKVKQSPLVDQVFCVPGNAGTAGLGENLPGDPGDIPRMVAIAKDKRVDLTIVGPEAPLAAGIADAFLNEGLSVFGPSKAAAQIESSKLFAKRFMKKHGMPCASYSAFEDYDEAVAHVKAQGLPVVIKADGLAAGKGVFVCRTWDDVEIALRETLLDRRFGEAGDKVIIEELLPGQEASLVVITDGEVVIALPSSEDHKQLLDGDKGPNTGGMGAFSPTDVLDDALLDRVTREIMVPAIRGMAAEGKPYRGALYAGLMIADGKPHVLEFNCRFGDPETQATFPRITSDLVPVFQAAASGSLAGMKIEGEDNHSICITLASEGYPGNYRKGLEISGLPECEKLDGVTTFHSGTKEVGGKLVTAGGRVLGITAVGATKEEALKRAYDAVDKVHFEGKYFRRDIATRRAR
ncbi:phosphoribosylamine--glycine ligase [bacterium]|nr:phosphoribosylamine--glycine ligase [bacterium]